VATIDTIGGGNIEPRGLEEEMRSAYLDYAMSVIVGQCATGSSRSTGASCTR
jgi:DNA gyrase subunit A